MMRLVANSIMGCLCILLTFCSGRSEDEFILPETIPVATIQFSSPLPNTTYSIGDSVAIIATALSTESIHGYDLTIRKVDDPTSIYFIHIHDHNDTLNIHEKWEAIVSTPSNLEAEISLYLDHAGHTKKEKVSFIVQ